MTEQDRPGFAELMLGLGETYGEPVSDVRMEIYFAALADLTLPVIRAAATLHVRTQKFFPRPSELREAIDGRPEDRAELAWAEVMRLVRRYGYPGIDGRGTPPEFLDEATRRAAMELYGGWRALCEKLPGEGPEMLGVAKVFRASHAAYGRAAEFAAALPPPTTAEAMATIHDLRDELRKRGLPTGAL